MGCGYDGLVSGSLVYVLLRWGAVRFGFGLGCCVSAGLGFGFGPFAEIGALNDLFWLVGLLVSGFRFC